MTPRLRVLVALLAVLPIRANAADSTEAPARFRWGSWTWTQHLSKPGEDRKLFFGARVSADFDALAGVHLIARADASAIGDGGAVDVNISDPATYQSLELYGGAYRPFMRGLAVIAVAGITTPIESGRPNILEPHPKTFGAGLSAVFDAEHKSWGVVMLGRHDAAGSGLRVLFTGQALLVGRTSAVTDMALGGRGSFVRVGLAVRLQ